MPVTKIRSTWIDGNLVFQNEDGETILSIDKEGLLELGGEGEQMPVMHYYEVSNDDGDRNIDKEITHKTEILDAWVIKLGDAENNDDNTVQLQDDDGTAITDEMDIQNKSDGEIVRAGEIDLDENVIEAGEDLRIRMEKSNNSDNNAVRVAVLGRRV